MATQTSTLTVKGKLGNVVGYKGRGKQLARIRVTEIKNPNTEGQAIQRMITATNSRAYSRLKEICDHSFEGIAYKQPSQDYFLKQNAKILRQFVAEHINDYADDMNAAYIGLSGKNDAYASGAGLLISKGTLPSVPAFVNEDGVLVGFGVTSEGTTVGDMLTAFGAQAGDQITLVGIDGDGVTHLSRYVLNAEITEAQVSAAFSEANMRAICSDRSIYGELSLYFQSYGDDDDIYPSIYRSGKAIYPDNTANLYCAAVILSRKAADGSWLRSTQYLKTCGLTEGLMSPSDCIAEWMAGTTEIDTESAWYLNQAKRGKSDF